MGELENITKLKTEFPLVFANEILCSSGFGDGWYPLVSQLCADIEMILAGLEPEERATFCVSQIKEKFGWLVFSTRNYIPANDQFIILADTAKEHTLVYNQILDLVTEAEKRSRQICEVCGAAGASREGSWIKTLCDSHANGAARWRGRLGRLGWDPEEQEEADNGIKSS